MGHFGVFLLEELEFIEFHNWVFDTLEAVNMNSGEITIFNNLDCQFGYRDSIFKQENNYFITSVTLKLQKQPKFNILGEKIGETLAKMGKKPSLKSISDTVVQIRQEKLPDPLKIPNAGSFFKNPVVKLNKFQLLQQKYPKMPHFWCQEIL